jgi:Protein of unknown function with PCYCGC motif
MAKKKKGPNWLLIGGVAMLVIAGLLVVNSRSTNNPKPAAANDAAQTSQATPSHEHAKTSTGAQHVPAFYTSPPSRSSLAPTLDPEVFTGITRDAYRAVKQIPTTIAQLPCYCHCDDGMGHKSLYSCFEDDHASHCAVCVNEALLALRLEREQKLTPAQIRERIVDQYSKQQ